MTELLNAFAQTQRADEHPHLRPINGAAFRADGADWLDVYMMTDTSRTASMAGLARATATASAMSASALGFAASLLASLFFKKINKFFTKIFAVKKSDV